MSALGSNEEDGEQDASGGQSAGNGQTVDDDQTAGSGQRGAVGGGSETAREGVTSACPEEGGDGLCTSDLAAVAEAGAGAGAAGNGDGSKPDDMAATGGVTVRPVLDETVERSAVCAWVAGNIAPYAVSVVQSTRGDTDTSCTWALDRSEVELGPFAQIFTPIAWRLGRENVQDAVSCLLDCGSASASADGVAATNGGTPEEEEDATSIESPAVAVPEEAPLETPADSAAG